MFAQILLGVSMLTIGICHFLKFRVLLGKSVKNTLIENELTSFQRGMVLPYILLGVTFIIMGVVESKGILPMPVFLGIYILLGAISLTMVLANNKKHTGYYFW
ncbi:hypothetical protein D3C73_1075510 [compost metagenome]